MRPALRPSTQSVQSAFPQLYHCHPFDKKCWYANGLRSEFLMKHLLGLLAAPCLACLLCAPVRASAIESTSYSIAPVTVAASAGDVGDAFDVLLTNNGSSHIPVAGFAFEVTVADTDVRLDRRRFLDHSCTLHIRRRFVRPVQLVHVGQPRGIDSTAQTLEASDLTDDSAGITLAPGQSLAVGEVLFNVANGATPAHSGCPSEAALALPTAAAYRIHRPTRFR